MWGKQAYGNNGQTPGTGWEYSIVSLEITGGGQTVRTQTWQTNGYIVMRENFKNIQTFFPQKVMDFIVFSKQSYFQYALLSENKYYPFNFIHL